MNILFTSLASRFSWISSNHCLLVNILTAINLYKRFRVPIYSTGTRLNGTRIVGGNKMTNSNQRWFGGIIIHKP